MRSGEITLQSVLCAAALATVLTLGSASPTRASPFRPGPTVFEELPTDIGDELGFVPRADTAAGRWPPAVLSRAREELSAGGRILVVGQTDPVGPRSLNHSLGLQLAAHAARHLVEELGVEPTRFAAATRGESASRPPGVTLLQWTSPPDTDDQLGHLVVLEPLPGVSSRGRFWGIWKGDAKRVLWAHSRTDDLVVWEVPPHDRVVRLPAPGRSTISALAGDLVEGTLEAQQVEVNPHREDSALRLRVETVEQGWVRARVSVPDGYTRPLVWGGGIPYRLVPDARGEAEVALARIGAATEAYAQAQAPDGSAVVGPLLRLPDDGARVPNFVAVLVWEGDGVDLDLHAWDGSRHTHLASPDSTYSESAVSGVRLLFDGAAWQPASAVAGWGREPPELSVNCYSDLGGNGAQAWLYVVRHADDPVRLQRLLLGPRHLSERPTQVQWPVLRVAEVAR